MSVIKYSLQLPLYYSCFYVEYLGKRSYVSESKNSCLEKESDDLVWCLAHNGCSINDTWNLHVGIL